MRKKPVNKIQEEIKKLEKNKSILENRLNDLKEEAKKNKCIFKSTRINSRKVHQIYINDSSIKKGPIYIALAKDDNIEKVMEVLGNLESSKDAMTALLNQYTTKRLD